MPTQSDQRPISQSLQEYGRGIAGGLLFSFPLLYTMEVWWTGFIASPFQFILVIVFTFILLLGYNRFAGMHPEATWKDVLVDSVEDLGIGFFLAFTLLFMLRRIDFHEMSMLEIMGKVVIEAMVISIGVSVGTAQLGVDNGDSQDEEAKDLKKKRQSGLLSLIVLGICGSVLIGGNVAPTEEVLVVGTEAHPGNVLAMALVSLAMSVLILFYSDFEGTGKKSGKPDLFTITQQTCVCYVVALSTSALLLWFFGRLDGVSFWTGLAQTVALGVLSSLGTSAGRLLIN